MPNGHGARSVRHWPSPLARPRLRVKKGGVDDAANLRSSPSTTGKVVGKLAAGERVEVLGGAPNSNWLLVGRNGYGVGYVSASLLDQGGYAQASCRIINASISTKGAAPSSERYSACKDGKGEWQLTTV